MRSSENLPSTHSGEQRSAEASGYFTGVHPYAEVINAAQQEHQCCSCHKLSNEAQCSCTNEVLEFRGGAHMTALTKHPTVEIAYLVAKDSPRV